MNAGSEPCAPLSGFGLIEEVNPTTSSTGAVSPITRATPSMTPVTMPGSAVGSTTRMIVRHLGTPSA